MEKLDKKDKKILGILDHDGRATVSEISRKTGIPRDSVNYRLQRMIRLKFISSFHTIINPLKLGYPIFSYVDFVFHNIDEKRENEFYKHLLNHKNVVYVAKTTGKWDCTIAVCAKDLEHFDEILRQIRRNFSDIIKEFDSASIIKEYKYDSMVELIE